LQAFRALKLFGPRLFFFVQTKVNLQVRRRGPVLVKIGFTGPGQALDGPAFFGGFEFFFTKINEIFYIHSVQNFYSN
jgi:hypothetical protein